MTDLIETMARALYECEPWPEQEPWHPGDTICTKEARAALAAIEAAGHRIVPVEPTRAMESAGVNAAETDECDVYTIWAAMLAAAPRVGNGDK